jgi:predicted nucleotidyltransferase component of viral defense system
MNKIWKQNLIKTIEYLNLTNIPPSEWSFGGGTVLMLHYHHRFSKDIDIFLTNAQYLTCISPRLNDNAPIIFKENEYTEQSNFVKIAIENGQYIDFILSPYLTKKPVRLYSYKNQKIQIESPTEIIIKKIFYRSETFKTRDIYDLGVVLFYRENELRNNLQIYLNKLPALFERINQHKKRYYNEVNQLELIGKYDPKDCFEKAKRFIIEQLECQF